MDGCGLSADQIEHLAYRYGSRSEQVLTLARRDTSLRQPLVSGLPDIWAEAVFAVRQEMAQEPDDILFRRTHVALKAPRESAQISERIKEKIDRLRN